MLIHAPSLVDMQAELQHKGFFEHPEMSQIVPCLHGLYRDDSLRKQLSKSLPELLIQSAAIKLQCNSGSGGCFPCHFDSDAEVDGRRVTAIVTLTWTGSLMTAGS